MKKAITENFPIPPPPIFGGHNLQLWGAIKQASAEDMRLPSLTFVEFALGYAF